MIRACIIVRLVGLEHCCSRSGAGPKISALELAFMPADAATPTTVPSQVPSLTLTDVKHHRDCWR